MKSASGSRLRRVEVSPQLFAGMLVHGTMASTLVTSGVPEGARVARAFYDDNRDVFVIVFEHESFEPLAQGEVIPTMTVEIARTLPVEEQGAK